MNEGDIEQCVSDVRLPFGEDSRLNSKLSRRRRRRQTNKHRQIQSMAPMGADKLMSRQAKQTHQDRWLASEIIEFVSSSVSEIKQRISDVGLTGRSAPLSGFVVDSKIERPSFL